MRLFIKPLPVLVFIFINFISYSQTKESTLSGSIKVGDQKKVFDAATISLLKAKDSSLVKISLADNNGKFSFDKIKEGNYVIMVTSAGYKKSYSKIISVGQEANVTAGIIQLVPDAKTLNEVLVVTKKPFIERKIDRTILNVDASITNAGTTAMEVLEKAPGVSIDKDGNISLKGKQGVIIMLDGKPSYLSGQDLANLLKNMPSSVLDQVEIMTNPSAKYDASGNSGIINIKTKKNKLKGTNGSFTTSYIQGIYMKNTNSLNLNYRNGKINLFGNYSYSDWNGLEDLSILRNFRNPTTKNLETIFDQHSFMRNHSDNNTAKIGLDFYANKKTTFGVVVSGFLNPSRNSGDNTTNLENANGRIDSIVYATNSSKSKSTNFGINLNYRHQYDSTGKELTTDLDYITYGNNQRQLFTNNYLNPDMTVRKSSNQLQGNLPSVVKIYSAKLDYTLPLKKDAKFEAGLKSSYVTTDNDAQYQNNSGSGWITDYGKTNHFVYKENINAAYLNFNRQIKKLGIQLGLRIENTNATGSQFGNITRSDSSFKRNYTNLFPTAYVSYELNKNNNLSINYGRRIDRPYYQDLNPFYYFLDEYTYQVGNTLLKPQFTDAIELSHTYKGFFTTTLNYSKTTDVFADALNQLTSERKTFLTKSNIASRRDAGIAVSANVEATKFWSTNIWVNIINDKYYGALNGGILNVSSTMFMTNVSNQFKFKKGWSAELSGFYRSKGIQGQIVADPMWRLNTGVQKQILKSKGTLKLNFSDIFRTQQFNGHVQYQDIDAYIHDKNDTRRASLTFTYRFGKPLKNLQQRKTGSAGDEQNRVKTGN